MTTTEPTTSSEMTVTGDRVVVIPEITIPMGHAARAQRVLDLLEEMAPQLDELHAAALEVREQYDRALVALYPYIGTGYDEVFELAGRVTGWYDVSSTITDALGDRFSVEGDMGTGGLTNAEIARGGEKNFPPGTIANIKDPHGNPIRVEVSNDGRSGAGSDRYVVRDLADPVNTAYKCDHAELKAGLESVPDEQGVEEARQRHVGWRMAAAA